MKKTLFLLLAAGSLNAADIRVIDKTQIDLTPIHTWAVNGKKGERPMQHWKIIKIDVINPGVPWATCSLIIENDAHKSVYLKNVPAKASQYFTSLQDLESRQKELFTWVYAEKQRLRRAWAVPAQDYSEFAQNRREAQANLENKQQDLGALNRRIKELKEDEKLQTTDLAMFTGQIYNKLEVWDCGQKMP